MRRTAWLCSIVVTLLPVVQSCRSPVPPHEAKLLPESISINGWIGYSHEVELTLELDGEPDPVALLTFEPATETDAQVFQFTPAGPLASTKPKLIYTPTAEGTHQAWLHFERGTVNRTIPIQGIAGQPEPCRGLLSGPCRQEKINLDTGRCEVQSVNEGQFCGGNCDQEFLCNQGNCGPRIEPLRRCETPGFEIVNSGLPQWLAPSEDDQDGFIEPGTAFDEEGNSYIHARTSQSSDDGIISIDEHGQERWRVTFPWNDFDPGFNRSVLMDDTLIVKSDRWNGWEEHTILRAFSTRNGDLRWERTFSGAGAPGLLRRDSKLVLLTLDGCSNTSLCWLPTFRLLDAATGAVEQEMLLPGVYDSQFSYYNIQEYGMDSRGNIVVSAYRQDPSTFGQPEETVLASFSVQGEVSWVHAVPTDTWIGIAAATGDWLVLKDGTVLLSATGEVVSKLSWSLVGQDLGIDSAVLGEDGAGYALVQKQLRSCSLAEMHIVAFDASPGQVKWECSLGPLWNWTDLLLLKDRGVALVTQGALGTPLLQSYRRDGTPLLLSCFGPELDGYDGPWHPTISRHRLLLESRRPSKGSDIPPAFIAAYEMPALELATEGWVSSEGGPARGYAPIRKSTLPQP